MTYQFDTEFAQRYGLQEAIFCQSLLYWIIKNAANERHWHTAEVTLPGGEMVTVEGYWMYNSAKAFTRLFPFWTARQIETIVKKCREKGLIYTANFAEKPTDRTTWYALTENVKCIYAKCEMDSTECVNAFTKIVKCLNEQVKNTVKNTNTGAGACEAPEEAEEDVGTADGRDPSAGGIRMTESEAGRTEKKRGGRKETPKAVIERLARYVNTFGALDAAQLGGALFDFAENRRALGSPIRTERAADLLLRKLDRLSGGELEKKVALLEEATLRGWKSVYPLRGEAERREEPDEEWT